MKWRTGRRSVNVEDRRGARLTARPVAFKGGLGGVVLLVVLALLFGVNPLDMLNVAMDQGGGEIRVQEPASRPTDEAGDFMSVVLAETEDYWGGVFQERGGRYVEPKLVLFSGAVRSACGFAQAAVGPFYCGSDSKVYIDLEFFQELKDRFGAPGDFAQAYVLAHEVGHHVQNLSGVLGKVNDMRRKASKVEANRLTVKLELQADCYAGLWAHYAQLHRKILDSGDLDEALNAASAIGDDRLQRRSQGYVTPDSFTHGTSAQRRNWFLVGFESGRFGRCDTFAPGAVH